MENFKTESSWMNPALLAFWAEQQGITPEEAKQKAIEGLQNLSKVGQTFKKTTQTQQPTQQQQEDTGALANVGTDEDVGALANVGDDAQQEDTKTVYMKSDHGNSFGARVGSSWITMIDRNTGIGYTLDQNDSGKGGGDMGWHGSTPPKDADLQITSWIDMRGDESTTHDVSDQNLTFGGQVDPETSDAYLKKAREDDKSDNDVYYEVMRQNKDGEWYAQGYTDVSGTGQSIPVGAFNITRDPTQLSYMENTGTKENPIWEKKAKDTSTYTQPVLTKTWQGYEPVTGMYSGVEGITPQQYANLSNEEKLLLAQSDVPTASTDFKDFFDMGSGQFDLGAYFGMDEGKFVMSNPPSNQFNLEKFFDQTEGLGTQNFLRSQSTDVWNDIIKGGNFLDALMGRNFKMADGSLYYDKIYNVVNDKITDPDDLSRYGVDPSRGYGTPDDPLRLDEFGGFNEVTGLGGGAIQGFDMGQLEGFFNELQTNKDPYTGDTIYSNTPYSVDPHNITGTDNPPGLQYGYAYSQRPLTKQMVSAYKGGLGPYANVQYLTRYGYTPEVGDEMLEYDEASGVYFDPLTGLPINPDWLEGFALGDPEAVETGLTEEVYRGQMTTNPTTGEKLYYDAEGNPVTEEVYQTYTDPMQSGVT